MRVKQVTQVMWVIRVTRVMRVKRVTRVVRIMWCTRVAGSITGKHFGVFLFQGIRSNLILDGSEFNLSGQTGPRSIIFSIPNTDLDSGKNIWILDPDPSVMNSMTIFNKKLLHFSMILSHNFFFLNNFSAHTFVPRIRIQANTQDPKSCSLHHCPSCYRVFHIFCTKLCKMKINLTALVYSTLQVPSLNKSLVLRKMIHIYRFFLQYVH